ncbi:MAG TPA: hypothetical protein VFU21_31540 [Kofleriaceae bacterium]|nr:hypothetical protein [Kofleriaceae bacterium]
MRRSLLVPVVVVLVALACGADEEKKQPGDPAAGHALLAEYVAAFQQLASSGGGVEVLDPLLAEQARNGDALLAAGKVSAGFAERHRRLIEVTRALVAPGGGEEARQKVRDFLDAVEGKKERALGGGLAEVAPAIVEEVLRLHMLLDGTTDREKTRARYMPDL